MGVAIVLYIDTDQLYMSTVKLLLEKHGFKVLLALTRDHMREVLLNAAVDVALIDQEFTREFPGTLDELRLVAPFTRTVLLGMRNSERPADGVDGYCARLDGPDKLISVLRETIAAPRAKGAPA